MYTDRFRPVRKLIVGPMYTDRLLLPLRKSRWDLCTGAFLPVLNLSYEGDLIMENNNTKNTVDTYNIEAGEYLRRS